MSRGVAYRADMLDDPTEYDVRDDAETMALDAGDFQETYRARRSSSVRPSSAPRHKRPSSGSGGRPRRPSSAGSEHETRADKASALRPNQQKSLDLGAQPKRKSRAEDSNMVELRQIRRTSSNREKTRPSSAGRADGGQKRSNSVRGKRQRSIERNDSATRLLDAVVLDDDYYENSEDKQLRGDEDVGILNEGPRTADRRGRSRPKSAGKKSSVVSIDSIDGHDQGGPVMRTEELEQLLSSLREKDDIVADLQERLERTESEMIRSTSPDQGGDSFEEDPALASAIRAVGGFSLSFPVTYAKPSQTNNSLLRIVQSAHSPLSHCSMSRQAAVVECMHLNELAAGSTLENRYPDLATTWRLCAVEKGELQLQRGETAEIIRRGSLIILPTPPDTWCSCRTPVQLWTVDAVTLNELQRCDASLKSRENLSLLRSVPEFQSIVNTNIKRFLQSLDERHYDDSDDLQLKGIEADNNLVHIVKSGEVKKTDRSSRSTSTFRRSDVIIPTIETVNTCRVRASGDVVCVVVEWKIWKAASSDGGGMSRSRMDSLEDTPQMMMMNHRPFGFGAGVPYRSPEPTSTLSGLKSAPSQRYEEALGVDVMQMCLSDLRVIGTLGAGAFGHVELVCLEDHPECTFALKRLSRHALTQNHHENQALREKEILSMLSRGECHPHITQLSRTFRDHQFVYFLLEPLLGGDLFSLCRRRGPMKDKQAVFYVACIINALEYLHRLNIIFRGLKPEDVLLDNIGYAKLCDFGHSKILEEGAEHTYSFCGTAEYMSPEQVLEESHGMPVDVWGLGVIAFELLCGRTPFTSDDKQNTYAAILKGIDEVGFPSYVSVKAAKFIRDLCMFEPHTRKGCDVYPTAFGVIRSLPWLKSFKWDLLRRRTLGAPFKPTLFGTHDLRYFDSVRPEPEPGTAAAAQHAPSGGWDAAF